MSEKDSRTPAELAYAYMREGYEQESKRMEALDSKSDLLVTISSFLTGVLLGLISLAYRDLSTVFAGAGKLKMVTGILLVLTNLSFLIAAFCSTRASAVRKYWARLVYQSEDIDRWVTLEDRTELEVFLAKQIQAYWLHNRVENDSKAQWLRRSTLFLSIGAVILSLSTLLVLGYLFVWVDL